MKPFWVFTTIFAIIVMTLFVAFVFTCNANTIGFSYDRAIDESNWGLHGDYETGVENLDFELEGQLQSGDAYIGNLDLSFTLFDYLRIESNNLLKGYELDTIGRKNNIGASFVFPIDDIEVAVGIFGVNGNPFEPVYELSDPTDPDSATIKDSGITIKEGSTLNAALSTELDLSRFEIGLRGLLELTGEGEKVHQFDVDIGTSGNWTDSINWTLQTRISAQLFGDVLEYETRILSGIEYPF